MILTLCLSCRILYYNVSYLYVSCSGSITSFGEKRANLWNCSCNYVSVRRGFLGAWDSLALTGPSI